MAMADLMVRMGLDSTAYNLGLKRVQGSTSQWGKEFVGSLKMQLAAAFSGTAIVGTISNLLRSGMQKATELKDLAEQLGVTIEEMSRFDVAAQEAGMNITRVMSFVEKLDSERLKAISEGKLPDYFRRLGYSLEDLQRAEQPAQFIIDFLQKAVALQDQLAIKQAMGPRGTRMTAFLDEWREAAAQFDSETAKHLDSAEKFQNRMRRMAEAALATEAGKAAKLFSSGLSTRERIETFLGGGTSGVILRALGINVEQEASARKLAAIGKAGIGGAIGDFLSFIGGPTAAATGGSSSKALEPIKGLFEGQARGQSLGIVSDALLARGNMLGQSPVSATAYAVPNKLEEIKGVLAVSQRELQDINRKTAPRLQAGAIVDFS